MNNSESTPFNSLFQIAKGSGATLSECTFLFEKAHVTKKTSSRQITSRPHDKNNLDLAISELFLIKNPGICSGTLKRRPSSSLCQKARGSGATSKWEYFFLQKGTHQPKISRSATWFRSRKHSDDACSCSTRPKGTRRGFQSSTMKCSGACWYETHRIPHKEGRRSSLTRTSFSVNLVVVLFCNPTRNSHYKPTRTLAF